MDLLQKALNDCSESKHIDFKGCFDPTSTSAWCETIKDIVALANSGGGIIVFGLDSFGVPTGDSVDSIVKLDPADCSNKLLKYTRADLELEIKSVDKEGHKLAAFIIPSVSLPIVFQQAGNYQDAGTGKQCIAFHKGTVYFRHGAKSEPGTTEDIRKVIDRQLDQIRKSWIKGERKVVKAPADAQFVALPATSKTAAVPSIRLTSIVRPVNDPNAPAVRLVRGTTGTAGSLIHEEVSTELFNEINNVIDANRILAQGQNRFFLGQPVYYRIYAERQNVTKNEETANLLLNAAMNFYAPGLFWMQMQSDLMIAKSFKVWFGQASHYYRLLKLSALLGHDFSNWFWGKVDQEWKNYAQPPNYYFTLKAMLSDFQEKDPRLIAVRQPLSAQVSVPGCQSLKIGDLLEKPETASAMLSSVCTQLFDASNKSILRNTARLLDYMAYGGEVVSRAPNLAKEIIRVVGSQRPAVSAENGDLPIE